MCSRKDKDIERLEEENRWQHTLMATVTRDFADHENHRIRYAEQAKLHIGFPFWALGDFNEAREELNSLLHNPNDCVHFVRSRILYMENVLPNIEATFTHEKLLRKYLLPILEDFVFASRFLFSYMQN
jgi:hypothetical protein